MESEAPSKTLLLERREERELVSEGKSVLEERRDTLAQAIMKELRVAEPMYSTLRKELDGALADLRQAALRHGPVGLRRLSAEESAHPEPAWRVANYFGTRMASVVREEAALPPETRWDSTEETARARLRFHRLAGSLIEMAVRLNNLTRLTREFRRTQRKVNALEHVIVPEIEQSIRGIEFALEETERENMVRALHVKRKRERS
jgi:V/A-type H+-transporting ATPase subunit D